jgi:hypothetical protein
MADLGAIGTSFKAKNSVFLQITITASAIWRYLPARVSAAVSVFTR